MWPYRPVSFQTVAPVQQYDEILEKKIPAKRIRKREREAAEKKGHVKGITRGRRNATIRLEEVEADEQIRLALRAGSTDQESSGDS